MADNEVQTVLKLKIDPAELNKALQGNTAAQASLKRMALEANQTEKELAKLRAKMSDLKGDDLDKATLKAARFEEQIAKTEQQAQKLVDKIRDMPKAASEAVSPLEHLITAGGTREIGGGTSDKGGRSGLSRVGAEIRALPAVPLGGGLSTDVLGKVVNTLGQLGPAGQAASIGVVAAIGALKAATGQYEATTKAIIASQKEYYTLLETGTRDQVKSAIDAKKQEVDILKAQIGENQRILGQFQQEAGGVGRAIADALDLGGVQQMRVQTQDLEQQLKTAELALKREEFALNSTEVATNSLVEAEKKLADQRTQATLQLAEDAAKRKTFELQSTQNISTDEQLKAAIIERFNEKQAIEAEIAVIKARGDAAGEASERIGELEGRLQDLSAETAFLFSDVAPLVKLKDSMEEAKKKAEELANASDKLRDAATKAKDIQDSYAQKLDDIASKVRDTVSKAGAELSKTTSDAIAQADADRAEIIDQNADTENENLRAALKEREDAAQEYNRTIKRIEAEGKRNSELAIEDRDSVALNRAQDAQKAATDQENENYGVRTKQIDDRLKEQNRLTDKRMVDQLQGIDKRLQQQISNARERYDQQIRDAFQYGQEQRSIAQTQQQQQLSDLRNTLMQDSTIRANANQAVLNATSQYATGLQAEAGRIMGLANALQGNTGGGGRTLPTPAAYGGSFGANSLLQVNEPWSSGRERWLSGGRALNFPGMGLFIPQNAGRVDPGRGGSSFTFAPTINATSKAAIRQQVMAELDRVLEAM